MTMHAELSKSLSDPFKGPYLLGVDVGTLSTKGVLTDAVGKVLARATADHTVCQPQPGWIEHDAERDWWDDFVRVVRQLMAQTELPPTELAALCVSGLFPALCPADEAGRPLRNAILYSDSRAIDEIKQAEAIVGPPLKGDEISPKLLWLRENEPEVFRRMRRVFGAPHSYVVYRLTGQYVLDHYTAYRLGGLVDGSRQCWSEDICRQLGFSMSVLPALHQPSQIAGRVKTQAAQQTGLPEGLPVLVGTADSFVTLLGSGVIERGDAIVYYGTTGWLGVCTCDLEDVVRDPSLINSETPYILAVYMLGSGGAFKWYLDQFGPGIASRWETDASRYEALDQEAARIRPGADGLLVLPHFSGRMLPHPDPLARGVIFGLTLSHTRAHLWRALQEAFGYGLLEGLETMSERAIAVRRVVATGGGVRSELWRQIVSDIIGLPQEYVQEDMACLGDAFLAGYGVGLTDSFQTMRKSWLQIDGLTLPKPESRPTYEKLFRLHQDLNVTLKDSYAQLAASSSEAQA